MYSFILKDKLVYNVLSRLDTPFIRQTRIYLNQTFHRSAELRIQSKGTQNTVLLTMYLPTPTSILTHPTNGNIYLNQELQQKYISQTVFTK